MEYLQIAEKLGVTPHTLSRWMGGHRFPSKDSMLTIELELEWPIDDQMAAYNEDCPEGKPGEYGRQLREFLKTRWGVIPYGEEVPGGGPRREYEPKP